jgi:competence protein ComEC
MPLVAYYFNQVAWLGLLANLFVVPLAGFLLVPLGLLSAVWILAAGGDTLPGSGVIQALFDLLAAAVTVMARIPGAEWHVASPTILSILVFYPLLYGAWRAEAPRIQRAACAVAAVAVLAWWLWSPRPVEPDSLRVTFLDVGQGDASLIELPDGQTILIDGGAAYDTLDLGRAAIGPYLWDRGIRRIDLVIGTHPQLDHIGGLPWLIRAFDAGRYWGNGIARDEPFFDRLQRALRERGIAEARVEEGQELVAGPCRLVVLNPPRGAPGAEVLSRPALSGTELNNRSVVTRLECGPHSFLFTADVETGALSRLRTQAGAARVVKVPHHGARSSLDESWIRQVAPEAAVISVGSRNAYGHPAPDVLAAYEHAGARLFRTDRDGAVWVTARMTSPHLEFHTARSSLPDPIPVAAWTADREKRNLTRLWTFLAKA